MYSTYMYVDPKSSVSVCLCLIRAMKEPRHGVKVSELSDQIHGKITIDLSSAIETTSTFIGFLLRTYIESREKLCRWDNKNKGADKTAWICMLIRSFVCRTVLKVPYYATNENDSSLVRDKNIV